MEARKTMKVTSVRLAERESRALHAVERSLAAWRAEVSERNYAGRDEDERDLCIRAVRELEEIRSIMLDRDAE